MAEIGLVSCVKTKRDEPTPPNDLYTSDYFEKMRSYAEQHHDDWWILSAKHGLLDPDGPHIKAYDETLNGAAIDRKREWSQTVYNQLQDREILVDGNRLIFHAGRDYYDELLPLLEDTPVEIEAPTDGLQFGETLAWYNEQLG